MANYQVLFLLDGGGNGFQPGAATLGERGQQQWVLDGDGRVEVRVQLVAAQVELPSQLQVHLNRAVVGNV